MHPEASSTSSILVYFVLWYFSLNKCGVTLMLHLHINIVRFRHTLKGTTSLSLKCHVIFVQSLGWGLLSTKPKSFILNSSLKSRIKTFRGYITGGSFYNFLKFKIAFDMNIIYKALNDLVLSRWHYQVYTWIWNAQFYRDGITRYIMLYLNMKCTCSSIKYK